MPTISRSHITSFESATEVSLVIELFLEISFPLSHRSAIRCGYFSEPWDPRY